MFHLKRVTRRNSAKRKKQSSKLNRLRRFALRWNESVRRNSKKTENGKYESGEMLEKSKNKKLSRTNFVEFN